MPTLSTKPEPDVALDGEEECCFPCWKTLPDHIFLHIFSYLDAASLHKAGLVSKAWLRVAFDELLWKDLFYRHWQISRTIPMAPGKYSWIQEYKRLLYHTPSVESEVLKQHADQVLHVSFSHNGKMFATCSKDGFIRVWDATYPTSLKYKADMRKFTWKYTQFSQFNSTDTLLLVSGVHFGSLSTSGEIAVFNLEGEFVMQSRVMNKPYDVFGTWYNDCYLLSGNLHWTGHLNSCSAIWLNKAYQETNSEEESVVMRLFKFSNINASSIRTIMVSKCLGEEGDVSSLSEMPDGGSTSQADINIAAIGEDSANQEAENIMEEEASAEETCKANEPEPSTSGEGQKKKTSKNVQSIQVYENGSFITKFLEVDDDEPNNKLNGTIQYSSDYRLAETPVLHPSQLLHRETSVSDMSERSPSGNLSVSDNSEKSMNVGSDLADNRCSSTEMEMSKSSTPDWSEELDSVQPHTADIDDSKASDVSSDPTTPASVQTLVHFHMSTETALCLTDYDGTDVFSTDCKTVNVNTNNAEDEPVCTDVLENLGDTGDVVESTKKRVLLGQQQTHGEIIRDPSPCDQLGNGRASSSSLYPRAVNDGDEVKIEKFEGEVDPKLTFCCVDYKKTKRMSSVTPLTDLEINSPSAGTSRSCAQSTICAVGTGTQSDENFEIQSSSSDVNIDCMPVKPIKCNILSENENTVETSSAYVTAENRDHQNEMETASQFPKQVCIRSQKSKSRKVGDKYLIFTKGSKTYTPHQIGIKRIKPMKAFSADGSRLLPNVAENTHNMDQGQGQGQGPAVETYDDVDHLIDMHGHIIGMSLSPDHRYLYVNSRPWPKNYHIENPLYPPPIAQEIDIHVIDLLQMREVGTMHRSHKAYTSNDECFFIFLDVCEEYVASGAEDKHGYLWDRHYGLCLHKYPHSDVVNSVAFNPSDPEVLVTVSDDFSIKIWRSHSREKEVVKAFNREHCIRLNYVQSIMSDTNTEEYTKLCLDEAEKT